jgi:hypothetical protein
MMSAQFYADKLQIKPPLRVWACMIVENYVSIMKILRKILEIKQHTY